MTREAPEYPAPIIKMSHLEGNSAVDRWSSSDPGVARQKDVMPLGGGNGLVAIFLN